MDQPTVYVIRVAGRVDPMGVAESAGLRGTRLDHPAVGDAATTELHGELPDQAALLGVLTTLYDLRLPLLSVACAPAERPADRT